MYFRDWMRSSSFSRLHHDNIAPKSNSYLRETVAKVASHFQHCVSFFSKTET